MKNFRHFYKIAQNIRQNLNWIISYTICSQHTDVLCRKSKKVDELPSPRDLQELAKLRDSLIKEFSQTSIGNEWIMCMENENGIKYITNYFLNRREELTEEDEEQFSTNWIRFALSKMC